MIFLLCLQAFIRKSVSLYLSLKEVRYGNHPGDRRPSRAYKEKFADKYGIEQLGLFGSVARGEQDEKSDIDVIIKLRRPSCFTCFGIQEELRKLFHRKVDLITLHENMFRSFLPKP